MVLGIVFATRFDYTAQNEVPISVALLLKQMPKKQTGFVLLLKQNKSDLVFHHQN